MYGCTYKHSFNTLLPLKIIFKTKKQKKRKPFNQGGQAEKPKGNRNKSRRVAGQTQQLGEATFLPCHYAVVFWLGGAVDVRLIFATFLFFFGNGFYPILFSNCLSSVAISNSSNSFFDRFNEF